MDSVEIVLDLEARFGVRLPDAECSRARTVADVAALVLTHMPRTPLRCPTAVRFYEVRRALVEHLGVARDRVRPGLALTELANPRMRGAWNTMRGADRLMPALEMSPRGARAFAVLTLAVLGLTLGALVWVGVRSSGWAVLAAIPIALGIVAVVLAGAGSRLARRAPRNFATVADLVRATAPLPPPGGSRGERLIAEQRVLDEVRRIFAHHLGLSIEKVRAELRLVEDLRMD